MTFKNEGERHHALVFARLGEGYTIDKAYRLGGKKGSAHGVIPLTKVAAGESETVDVTKPLDPGDYVLFCPDGGLDNPHYKFGQLTEFAIE